MRAAIPHLLVAIVLFGGAWPITKAALSDATPMWFAAGRAGLAALTSALVLLVLGRLHWPRRADWPAIVALGTLQLGGYFALAHTAVAIVPAGRTAIISAVTSYWLLPMSILVMGERISARGWVGAALGLAGVVVLAGPWALDWTARDVVLGHGMLMLAAGLWSVAIIVTRARIPASPMMELLPWCFGIAFALLAPFAMYLEPEGGIHAPSWPIMLYIGVIVAPVGTWCVIEIGRRLPGAVSSLAFLLVPAFGVALSALWLGESVGWDVVVGSGLIVASVATASRA
ncbi:MAG: Threonine/homoserine efflux transporter RhtA [Rhodospirillales bacterium]|jgi:O-acetylserine/cysteine efflux transporter|nr:Threonine/homoserine efflux transporter RhtA [Rhodospirillales bacterium]MDB5380983.1 Threonine/homoserine efflux transporter RhtA [Rhodospirillales bacterium]